MTFFSHEINREFPPQMLLLKFLTNVNQFAKRGFFFHKCLFFIILEFDTFLLENDDPLSLPFFYPFAILKESGSEVSRITKFI